MSDNDQNHLELTTDIVSAYVGTVLRNLWIYEAQLGMRSDSRAMLAQGRWPRVPSAGPATVQIAGWRGGGSADR